MKKLSERDFSKSAVHAAYDNVSRQTLLRRLYKDIEPITRGFFRDNSWQSVKKVWNHFDRLDLNWHITDNYYGNGHYDKTVPPERKRWHFEINFKNEKGNPNKIVGTLTAAGAGSVEDPLSRYDITVVMS